ncbi:hypothetical protein QQ045_029884 [Rhodiola kirilowii]
MCKAFDRVNWNFLEELQLRMGFPREWVKKVMMCVKSVAYRVKINNLVSAIFLLERGLRQGDPLSPYLFVICTELISRNLEWHQNNKLIYGVRVSRSAPMVSNLMFVDDIIFFLRAEDDNIVRFKSILRHYEQISGQLVNYVKSEICMSNTIMSDRARALSSILGVN